MNNRRDNNRTDGNRRDSNRRNPNQQNPYNILPPPAILEEYEDIAQGSVDKLLEMAKKEQEHRHDWQEEHLRVHGRIHKCGQIFALIYNILLLGLVYHFTTIGQKDLALKIFCVNAFLMAFAVLVTSIERKIMNRRPPRRFSQNKKPNNNRQKR